MRDRARPQDEGRRSGEGHRAGGTPVFGEVDAVHGPDPRRGRRGPGEPGRRAGAGPPPVRARRNGALPEADALCVVLRAFGPDPDPRRDLAEVRAELILADLAVMESALENARRRLKGRSGTDGAPEIDALERAVAALSDERPLRAGFDDEAGRHLRGLGPLTLKPWVVVANLEEGSEVPAGLPPDVLGVWAEIEAETAGIDEEDARALMREFGVEQPGLAAVIAASYRALDLITFLTTGEDETRAWEVRRGATAPEAAGVIHTDLQRGDRKST